MTKNEESHVHRSDDDGACYAILCDAVRASRISYHRAHFIHLVVIIYLLELALPDGNHIICRPTP
jgi:hypothetical protein